MTKKELIKNIEEMKQDCNYMLNSHKGNEKQRYAWEYTREQLILILKLVNMLDN
jgi:hypothetical protein